MEGYSLLLEFSNLERDFALGFECGRIWAILAVRDGPVECEMHVDNAEMILRMAEAAGREVRWEQHDDVWATAYFSVAVEAEIR